MKGIIVLNGQEVEDYVFPEDCLIIACDGGYRFLEKRKVLPGVVLGDFDSLKSIPPGAKVFPIDKDFTDGELGLLEAKNLGLTEVEFVCAGGGRDDQFFANVGLLEKAINMGISARIITEAGEIYYCDRYFSRSNVKDRVVSIYPLEKSLVKRSLGLKYPCDGIILNRGDTLGISNFAVNESIELFIEKGAVLVFINKQ